jgi:hypothetical protein
MSVSTTSNALERMKGSAVEPSGASVTSYASSRISAISPPPPLSRIHFKLDRRLTRSLYMGDRWGSPPT